MKLKNSLTVLFVVCIFASMTTAVFAGNIETNNFFKESDNSPLTGVDSLIYRCTDNNCVAPQGAPIVDENSGATNTVVFEYPTTQNKVWYAQFFHKACYIPMEFRSWSFGTGKSVEYDVEFVKEPICKSLIDNFYVESTVKAHQPVTFNVSANLDATTNSAFTDINDFVNFLAGDLDHYSVETKVTLRIKDSDGNIVHVDTLDFNILMDTTENAHFEWTPTEVGEYTAELITEVTDCQCENGIPQSTSKTFTVIPDGEVEFCYTILNDLSINNDNVVEPNDPIVVSATKISNKINDLGTETPLPTDISLVIKKEGVTVFTENKQLSANPNSVDPVLFSIDAGLLGYGNYIVSLDAIAANCPYIKNNAEQQNVSFISLPKVNLCGDGVVDETEQCDDGNTDNNDGCSNTCEFEFCGDGVLQEGEFCDDGNNEDGDGCSAECNVEECRYDSDCTDELFCNGEEVCNPETYTCEPGEVVECDNGLFCDGTEICSEELDKCVPGEEITCDNGLFCDGEEVCDESKDKCVTGEPVLCDNGLFCDGDEVCDESKDKCVPGVEVDCSGNNIDGIDTCDNVPDDNTYTKDHRVEFISVCDEATDMCTEGNETITHDCDIFCGADVVCDGKQPGEGPCDEECMVECTEDWHCFDGNFCNGREVCNPNTYTCEPGEPVVCDDGLFCNGEEVCNEDWDLCEPGEVVECNDGLFCNGDEVCNEELDTCDPGVEVDCSNNDIPGIHTCTNDPDDNDYTKDTRVEFISMCDEATDMCTEGDPKITHACDVLCGADPACQGKNPGQGECDDNCQVPECTEDYHCFDGLFCNGKEVCVDNVCEPGEPVVCDNGLFCDGKEFCNEHSDRCETTGPVVCDNGLWCDGEEVCDESKDKCVSGPDVDCSDNDIPGIHTCTNDPDDNDYTKDTRDEFISVCDEYKNKCTEGDPKIHHICDTVCGADPQCHNKNPGEAGCDDNCQFKECTYDWECYDGNFCNGKEVCDQQTYTCKPGEPVVCDDGLFCNGEETCNERTDRCESGDPVVCDNGLFCDGQEVCDEYKDKCVDGDPVVCDDGLYCNGQERCSDYQDKCVSGPEVDCSDNNIPGVYACDHNPDNNDYTKDTRDEFISECIERTDSCSEGDPKIHHVCDVFCGADDACHGKNPGEDGCDDNCMKKECTQDWHCYDGNFCNGKEVCDQQTYTCKPGEPVVCDDGLFCNGKEFCNEHSDRCESTEPPKCDDGLFCNGQEVCDEYKDKCVDGSEVDCSAYDIDSVYACDHNPDNNDYTKDTRDEFISVCDEYKNKCTEGDPKIHHICDVFCGADSACHGKNPGQDGCDSNCQKRECHTDYDCDNGFFCDGKEYCDQQTYTCKSGTPVYCDNGKFCDGVERCDESQNKCVSGSPVVCDNGKFCDGEEVCDEYQDKCVDGTEVDCSAHNVPGINTCNNHPDGNSYTKDFRQEFISSCDERTDTCTEGPDDIEHTCDIYMCGAECTQDSQCADSDCDYLDGCYGEYYLDFDDAVNTCTDGCGCTDNQCKNPTIYPNDPRCVQKECTKDSDCDNGLFCDGLEKCNLDTYMCEAGTPIQCDDGQFCNGLEICVEGPHGHSCEVDALIPIDDGIECTEDICDEVNDKVLHIPQNNLCDDGLFCNGVEVCNEYLGCQSGVDVDCSANDIDGIDSCNHNPDGVSVTRDYRASFDSVCDEANDKCTIGDDSISHTCDVTCGADTACDGQAPGGACSDVCVQHECSTDADCNDGLFCNGEETCDPQTWTCHAGTAPEIDDGISCTVDSCDEVNDVVKHVPDNNVCDNSLFCDGAEVCDTQLGCVAGVQVDCSTYNIPGVDTCNHSPDSISTTKDFRAEFVSVCNEDSDACTMGDDTITHVCDLACGAEPECDGVDPSTNDCSFECKFKPPVLCEHDGVYSNDMGEGHQFVCRTDNTYYECNQDKTAYVHVNVCSFECSADLACDGVAPGDSLGACDISGKTYLEDYCDSNCQIQDDNCESGLLGCTADVACDELAPGTGGCTDTCEKLECLEDLDCNDGLFCNGVEICDVVENKCVSGHAPVCDDGLYCNGPEVCDEATDSCTDGTAVDCSAFDIEGVDTCTNDPDGNDYTKDFRESFTSTCDEGTDSCTTGLDDITHTCDLICGAECTSDAMCDGNSCEDKNGCYLHGELVDDIMAECFGDTSCTKRVYESADSFCDLNTCGCSDAACTEFTINETDMDHDGFDVMCDLDCDDTNPDVNPGASEICDGLDNDCDGEIDEGLYGGDFRISYGSRHTGDVVFINGFDNFTFERIDFFHGHVYTRGSWIDGFGSMVARGTTVNGTRINLNIKFDAIELLDRNCMTVTWRNSARGTFWIEGESIKTVVLEYMDVTYNFATGEMSAKGVGEVPFELEGMMDNKFNKP